ncbi:MAG: serine/threonine-protein kinase [Myxococcota bacterium]
MDARSPEERPLVVGRYSLHDVLGHGGSSRVWRAWDGIDARWVAFKRLQGGDPDVRRRVAREALALRNLVLPRVVRLRDQGEDEDGPFLVMDLVVGVPFPGAEGPVDWEWLEPRLVDLLSTMAKVHNAGIIHRDLKPANVLVLPEGHAMVLDFGIARGENLPRVTRPGVAPGTPGFMAPEQHLGAQVDARSDLFAIGVMAWLALTGEYPYPNGVLRTLEAPRLLPRLEELGRPAVPGEVAWVIESMLRLEIDVRAESALHVLSVLRSPDPGLGLPLLDRDVELAQARALLEQRRPLHIVSPRGAGATRFLQALEASMDADVVWAQPSNRPFGSLVAFLGEPAVETLAEARAWFEERLSRFDDIVFVDRMERMDRWSRGLLSAFPLVVRVDGRGPGDVELGPLSVAALYELFDGHERIFRVRTRASQLLHRRTQGLASHVVDELNQWIQLGFGRREGQRIVMETTQLDALESAFVPASIGLPLKTLDADLDDLLAWIWLSQPRATRARLQQVSDLSPWELEAMLEALGDLRCIALDDGRMVPRVPSQVLERLAPEAREVRHAALAGTHPRGALPRIQHLMLGGRSTTAARECAEGVRWAEANGELDRALGLFETLSRSVEGDDQTIVLTALAEVAVTLRTADPLNRALRTLGAHDHHAQIRPWLDLLRACEVLPTSRERAWQMLEPIRAPDETPLGRWVAVIQAESVKNLKTQIRQLCERYEGSPSAVLRDHVRGWRGVAALRERDYQEAIRWHEPRTRSSDPVVRVSGLFNIGVALLERGQLRHAASAARALFEEASAFRLARWEARAEFLLRNIAYREGRPLTPDAELIDAVDLLGIPAVLELILCVECAVAWRYPMPDVGMALLQRIGLPAPNHKSLVRLLLNCFRAAFVEDASLARDCAEQASLVKDQREAVGLQGLALVAEWVPDAAQLAVPLLAKLKGDDVDRRREVMSIREACTRLGLAG